MTNRTVPHERLAALELTRVDEQHRRGVGDRWDVSGPHEALVAVRRVPREAPRPVRRLERVSDGLEPVALSHDRGEQPEQWDTRALVPQRRDVLELQKQPLAVLGAQDVL